MQIPEGWATVPGYAKHHKKPESTIRYQVKHGLLPHRYVTVRIPIVPLDATPIHESVKGE